MKAKVEFIAMFRTEGPLDDGLPPTYACYSFAQANEMLRKWGESSNRPGQTYDKIDFWVKWKGFEVYEGRYDLLNPKRESPDLARHVKDWLSFQAGRWPSWMSDEEYADYVAGQDPEFVAECERYLDGCSFEEEGDGAAGQHR